MALPGSVFIGSSYKLLMYNFVHHYLPQLEGNELHKSRALAHCCTQVPGTGPGTKEAKINSCGMNGLLLVQSVISPNSTPGLGYVTFDSVHLAEVPVS